MKYDEAKMNEAKALLHTLLRVRNEGLELGMEDVKLSEGQKYSFELPLCDTVCCVEGWHRAFTGQRLISKNSFEKVFSERTMKDGSTKKIHGMHFLIFGAHRQSKPDFRGLYDDGYVSLNQRMTSEQTLAQQIALLRWIIRREQTLQEWEFSLTLPKRVRREREQALRVAA